MKSILYIFLFCLPFTDCLAKKDTIPSEMKLGPASMERTDITYGNPMEEIPFMALPRANVQGDANLTFPIKLPPARQDLLPNIDVQYISGTENTWLGAAWNITLSQFELDTRWGVPRFDGDFESEIYLFDGEQMAPVFHRSVEYPREGERQFHLRQEQAFNKIIRHGDSPQNYWWEVIEKDGLRHFYGGNPVQGLDVSSCLRDDNNNIVKWMVSRTIDLYGNAIDYRYQKVQGLQGINIYPQEIRFNGFKDQQGNYSIQFFLKDDGRGDRSFSARTGLRISEESLLDRIEIRHLSNIIRSYRFQYEEGAFSKSLLTSIAEWDSKNTLFYEYNFEYYNDLSEDGNWQPFEATKEWSVAKDNIDVGSISGNLDGFQAKSTILGGSKSTSTGGQTSVTVGFTSNPATKDFTVGPNGGITSNNSIGLTAFVDIDGDGLPDKVWKEDDGLYFRSNLYISEGLEGFGPKTKIDIITDFSKSNTFSWHVGAELNVPPVYAGFTHEEGTTNITTYFADVNGDELIDIVWEGKVYFNYLVDGKPHFSEDSSFTPSEIFKGAGINSDLIPVDTSGSQLEDQSPLHDVVRVWVAPKSGIISIDAPVRLLEDTSPESQEYLTKDGVRVSIQLENIELWKEDIDASDFSSHLSIPIQGINVSRGDELYFRVHSIYDGSYDRVEWNPIISYENIDETKFDINGLSHKTFEAKEEFLLSERKPLNFPKSGVVVLRNNLQKEALSDSVHCIIEGPIQYRQSYAGDEILDLENIADTFWVEAGWDIHFSITAKSNVKWNGIQWMPSMEYIAFDDGSEAIDDDGKSTLVVCASVEHEGYYNTLLWGQPTVIPTTGFYNYKANYISLLTPSSYQFALKFVNKPDSIIRQEGAFLGVDSISFSFYAEAGDQIQGEYLFNSSTLVTNSDFSDRIVQDQLIIPLETEVSYRGELKDGLYGHLYRGWGQFIYDGNDGRGNFPISVQDLMVDTTEAAQDTTLVDEESSNTEIDGATGSNDVIIVMTSDPKLLAWRGSDEFALISEEFMSSSRKGQKYPGSSPVSSPGDKFNLPALQTKYYSNGGFGGMGVPGTPISGSAGYTAGTHWSTLDIMDLNGDRYPDIINETGIQFTNHRGGLLEDIIPYQGGIHESTSEAFSLGIGLNPGSTSPKNAGASPGAGSNRRINKARQKTRSNASKARSSFESATEAIGLSANVGEDNDEAVHSFLDINGDGLDDKIWNNGDVAINLGYRFDAKENWGFEGIRAGDALDIGGGIGLDISNGSIMGGVSVTSTTNGSKIGFIDLNTDGLPDFVSSVDPISVQFNTGSGFAPPVEWYNVQAFDEGVAIGESVNAGFTFSLIFFWVKISFNIQGFAGQGTGTVTDAFQDINGDGFPDYLFAKDGDDNLSVNLSRIGRTNLLKRVNYPAEAKLDLSYTAQGNTSDVPFSKWTLSLSEFYDGWDGDGESYTQTRMNYDQAYYDRHERQFYGFREVKEDHILEDTVYRTLVSEYYIDNYYRKALIKSQGLRNSNGLTLKLTEFTYDYRNPITGEVLAPLDIQKDDISAFLALSQIKKSYQEEGGTFIGQQFTYFQYDKYGNITEEREVIANEPEKIMNYSYEYDLDNYLVNLIKTESTWSDNQLLRETSYDYFSNGAIENIKQRINEQEVAITSMSYDDFGNVLTMLKPENAWGERMEIQYTYEGVEHQYLNEEKDGYGYVQTYEYEPLFGKMIKYEGINGEEYIYRNDERGRPIEILLPIDADNERTYSIKYEYRTNLVPYSVHVSQWDEINMTDFHTFSYADGAHRNIQNQKQAEIGSNGTKQEVLICSGKVNFDGLGREKEMYLQNYIPFSLNAQITSLVNTEYPAQKYAYDVLDRMIYHEQVDGGKWYKSYSIEEIDGQPIQVISDTDALGVKTIHHYSLRGSLKSLSLLSDAENSVSYYVHDVIGQLTSLIDPLGKVSSYDHDLLGRRISINTPDGGLVLLTYDATGNILERSTPSLRALYPNNGQIRYRYDKERLVEINYPKNFQNKVQIHYGEANAEHGRVGRVWLLEDATGGKEYYYDQQGNVNKTIQTLLLNKAEIVSYVSTQSFDAFNRIISSVYPDGEQVQFHYNKGGQIERMTAEKDGKSYEYIKELRYDHYDDLIYSLYGNDVIDVFNYDGKGRISQRLIKNDLGEMIKEETYNYDLVDNLINRNDKSQAINWGMNVEENYVYDDWNRMISSTGRAESDQDQHEYNTIYDFNLAHQPLLIHQEVKKNGNVNPFQSRFLDYRYEGMHASRPNNVGGRDYHYDENGNISLINSAQVFEFYQNIYDEENRLMGHSNNGVISRYTYDAFGRRVIKSYGNAQGVFVNGAPSGLVEHHKNYEAEVSSLMTIYDDYFEKHYYIHDIRFMSKRGTGYFTSELGEGNYITAGGIDYKDRMAQYEASILDYYASLGVPPGPPTLLAFLGQPEINSTGLPNAINESDYHATPPNWPSLNPPDSTGPPGAPIFFDFSSTNNEEVEPGFNFTAGAITFESMQDYYHYDGLHSQNFVTGYDGKIKEYVKFFPSGELWLHQSGEENQASLVFKGTKIDEETGYFLMDELYFDPISQLSLNVNSRLSNIGLDQIKNESQGLAFFEYEDFQNEKVNFDTEIINSERPNPLISNVPSYIDEIDHDGDGFTIDFRKKFDAFRDEQGVFGKSAQEVKNRRRKEQINPATDGISRITELNDILEAFDTKNLQNENGFDPNSRKAFKELRKEAKKTRARKDKLKKRKKQNKRKVRFRL